MPGALVAVLNDYLSEMTDIVESHGGFVDKYIGDAIVAIFGAPLSDPAHAQSAIAAALECDQRLAAIQDRFVLPGGRALSARIGLNTGPALVGNIGSRRRFNYTVIGDAVDLAARLESANKLFGTAVLLSGETARAGGGAFRLREIDQVRVVGRTEAVAIFEPLGRAEDPSPIAQADLERFAAALAADPPAGQWDGVSDLRSK